MPFIPAYIGIKTNIGLINLQRVLLMPLFIMTLALLLTNKRVRRNVKVVFAKNYALLFTAAIIIALRVVSSAASIDVGVSIKTSLYEAIVLPLLYIATIMFIDSNERANKLVKIICAALVLVSLQVIIERALEQNVFVMLGVSSGDSDDYLGQALASKTRGAYRAQGSFYNPLSLAHYLIFMLPLLYSAKKLLSSWRVMRAVYIAMTILAALATGSRAALLIVMTFFIYAVAKRIVDMAKSKLPSVRVFGVFAGIVFLIVSIALSLGVVKIIEGGNEQEQSSTVARLSQLSMGVDSILENPILGIGPRMAATVAGTSVSAERVSIDNFYLSMAIESGLLVLLLYIIVMINLISKSGYTHLIVNDQWALGLRMSFILFAVFFFISSLYEELMPFLVLLMALESGRRAKVRNSNASSVSL